MAQQGMEPFPKLPNILGVLERYIAQKPEVLILQEHFCVSGNDFDITTADGYTLVHCTGKAFSMSGRTAFTTPEGQPLFTLRKEVFSIPASYFLEDPGGVRFVEIEGRWSWVTPKFDIKFVNAAGGGQQAVLELRGDWMDRNCDICWQGLPVARIRRQIWGVGNLLTGQQNYGVQVAQGVDLALIAALVVGLNASYEAKRRS